MAEARDAFEFDAAGADLSALEVVEGCVIDDDVGFSEIEDGGCDEAGPCAGLELYAAFVLASAGGLGLSVRLVGAVVDGRCGIGKKARGIGEVGRDAHIGEVGDASAAGEALIGLATAGRWGEEVFDVVDGEVLTAAQGEDQVFFVLDLVLSVETVLLQERVLIDVVVERRDDSCAVDGVEDVDVGDRDEGLLALDVHVSVVVAEEDGVFPISGLEAAQSAVVYGVDVVPAWKSVGCAGDVVEVVGDAGVEAVAVDGGALEVDVLVAVVGVEVPAVGEEMVAGIGEGGLVALDLLPVGLADESANGDDTVGVEGQGAL